MNIVTEDGFHIGTNPHPFVRFFRIGVKEMSFDRPQADFFRQFYIIRMFRPPFAKDPLLVSVLRTYQHKKLSDYYESQGSRYLMIGPHVKQVAVLCYRASDGVIHFGVAINQNQAYYSIKTWSLARMNTHTLP